jgi:2,3-bisphosphoglycerate-dependent phosphoglycerate mutase
VATTIVLVRHGETDWNRDRRFQGHADVPLNELGRRQARDLADTLASDRFAAAYSSPLRRALETGEIVAARLGIPLEVDQGLMEIDVGSWSGLTTAEVEQRFPDEFGHWRETRAGGWTDGETYPEMGARVISALRDIAGRHPGERVLAVSHGGPLRAVKAAAAGLSFEASRTQIAFVQNCEVVTVAIRDGIVEEVH